MCEKTIQLLRHVAQGQNLVPLRTMAEPFTATVDADATENRHTFKLTAGPRTKGYLLRLIAWPTAEDGDAVLTMFRVNAHGSATDAFTRLIAGHGDHLQAGAKHVHVMPALLRECVLDVAGLDAADLTAQAAARYTVELWELVSAEPENCPA